ncbi:M48 family metallopeptidase [Patescibacteria group bacterium]|nr:M48 family metallopeptidase [Patescibacteria group bacterium]
MYNQITKNKQKSFLLMLIFVAVIALLAWVWSQYSNTGSSMVVLAIVIASLMSLFSFYAGDKLALSSAGAKEIKREDNPYVWRMVENLSITAGLPMPKVYIINDANMNAFATGRDPEHASIALTTGIIQGLENEELEGVIAHELAHVKNYDIRVMMVVIVCIGIITLLSDWLLHSFLWRGNKDSDNKANAVIMVIGLILAILSPLFAQLIQMAVSRKREFLADASGALLTRYPEGLARALEKISAQNSIHQLSHANKATAHLYFANPFKAKNVSKLFSTHPPVEERIQALRTM